MIGDNTDEEPLLPSTTQIAVLASEISYQQVLLKIESNLIEIFCASMLVCSEECPLYAYILELLWSLLLLCQRGQNVSCPNFVNFSQSDAAFVGIRLLIFTIAHVR